MDKILLMAFGIAFVLGLVLVAVGAWKLWQKIKEIRRDREIVK